MDDPGSSPYLTAAVCLVLSAFLSGSEAALFSCDRIGLVSRFKGRKRLDSALRLKDDPKSALSGILLGNTLVNIVFASSVAAIALSSLELPRSAVDLVATAIGTALVVIFGEISPKLVARVDPEKYTLMLSPALSFLGAVMRPFSHSLEKAASLLSSRLPPVETRAEELTEARLLAAVDYVETRGAIRNDEKEMIYGVIESKELQAKDVMVPRPRMIAVQEDRPALDALNLMLRYGFSRLPLFAETRDNITGIVHIKDLVAAGGGPDPGSQKLPDVSLVSVLEAMPSRAFATRPHFVPEGKRVRDLLREMRSLGVHMSIVVDGFDGVSGLVTLEDLLEEIVGEIRDEHDGREPSPVALGEGAWQVPGRMSLSDLESFTDLEIEIEDCDSVAGVVMKCLDRVPVTGDSFTLDEPPLLFEVKEVSGPRIQKVVIRRKKT